MKPLLRTVVVICLLLAVPSHQEDLEVKALAKSKEPVVEAEESDPQTRKERCTTCTSNTKTNIKSPHDVLAAIKALPGAEVHTQQSFESCSSEKGCAGLKVKDGKVIQKFGNLEAFQSAAAADTGNEFTFHAAGSFPKGIFDGGIPSDGPFWWMNKNSPFKSGADSFEKYQTSSSFSTTGAGGAGLGGSLDISANPFLSGEFSKLAGGFTSAGAESKPSSFQSSSYESSSFSSSNKGEIDISKNPFLNGALNKFGASGLQGGLGAAGFGAGAGASQGTFGAGASQGAFGSSSGASQSAFGAGSASQGAFGAGASQGAFGASGGASQGAFGAGGSASQGAFGAGASQGAFGAGNTASQSAFGATAAGSQFSGQSAFGANKFASTGYTGSSPTPFTTSPGSNVNLIQNTQKASEFEYEQQSQQNIDEAFRGTGNVQSHIGGGDLQQTCAGQGYVCVHKAQCNNGVVNTNGVGAQQAANKKQYCNTRTEVCCRMEISAAGGQGSLGVGLATFSGSSGSNQGSSIFGASQGSGFGAQGASSFGANQGSSFGTSQTALNKASSSFGSQNAFGSNTGLLGNSGTSFNAGVGSAGIGSGSLGSSSAFDSSFANRASSTGSSFGANSGFGSNTGAGFGASSSFGSGIGSANRGVTVGSAFDSSRGSTIGSKFGAGFAGSTFGTTPAPVATTSRFGANTGFSSSNSQSNFIETDSFSSGSSSQGVYRPGASGSGLKPGIPYLPPVDTINSGSNIVSSTAFPSTFITTPRPITSTRPYIPPVSSTSAPGYLPPQGEPTNTRETKIPPPTYTDGQLILDENRQPNRPRPTPGPVVADIPAGCAAALKCTPIEFCTAEGVISNTTVILTRDQESYRVPLTDCKDLETGRIGKCCRDPLYTDPWPTNQLGKWVPGVFGGNDGKYVPDSRGSANVPRPVVTARPPTTGSVYLNNFRNTKPTVTPYGPNQVTPGYPTTVSPFSQKGQYESKSQGQFGQAGLGGQGQIGVVGIGQTSQGAQGQFSQGSQFTQTSQFGQSGFQGQSQRGQGQFVSQGSGSVVSQGIGQGVRQGQGEVIRQGQSTILAQGGGLQASRGQAAGSQGQFGAQGQFGIGQSSSQGQFGSQAGGQSQFASQAGGQSQFGAQGAIGSQSQFGAQGQFGSRGQAGGQFAQGGGQFATGGQGQFVSGGGGQFGTGGQGQFATGGQGQFGTGGQGQFGLGGQLEIQGLGVQGQFGKLQASRKEFGQALVQGEGKAQKVTGQAVITGQGEAVSQGVGSGVRQGGGFAVSQGSGFGVENEYSESVQRVFLSQYKAGGQCGVFNGQKPYGNRNELEVDFAEIPWQAMVLLQTNRSLLCGGVITRPDVVITSAACVDGLDAKNVLIKGGEWKLGIDDEPLPFQIVQVKTILRHPFYKRGSLLYDAAILVLSENLRFAKNIYPICLPGSSETLDAFYNGAGECIVTGWGKQVLQAHLAGSIMHSLNVSLINPGECQSKISQDYPHLLEQYDKESCVCGQPTNPTNNICSVDIGSALACTTGDGHFVLRGVYSWDSGCQLGNQLAAFYKFDLEWYEWAIGLIESTRFAKFTTGTSVSQNRYTGQINSAVKGSQYTSGVKGASSGSASIKGGFGSAGKGQFGFSQGQFSTGQFSGKVSEQSSSSGSFGTEIKAPISNSFSATYSEKKVFQTEPKIITYTTKPEIVTFTTKPEYFTYTTKPKIISYTTKPQIITYETSGSGTNPQYAAPGVSFNTSFSDVVGSHTHNAQCKCLENGK